MFARNNKLTRKSDQFFFIFNHFIICCQNGNYGGFSNDGAPELQLAVLRG